VAQRVDGNAPQPPGGVVAQFERGVAMRRLVQRNGEQQWNDPDGQSVGYFR